MPSRFPVLERSFEAGNRLQHDPDEESRITITTEAAHTVADLHRRLTAGDEKPEPFSDFESYLRHDEEFRPQLPPLSVCFRHITTYGHPGGTTSVKTLKDAIWRTLTLQDVYERTIKSWFAPSSIANGQAIIRDFSGIVRSGQILLVLGNPGSGCSTFLRTIANDHSSFLGVQGSIDYSGLSPADIQKYFRGSVAYIPEDDVHLPTLTVKQTLDFAVRSKTPKRWLGEVPRFLDEFAKVFGMTHAMDTLVGNEYIRGISGGERKRVSILESLASEASVSAWDCSTRGLDASSALDYIKSLRILTDACQRATIISLYQASDAIYNLVDRVLLIGEGRMLFQGPADRAEAYFNSLGYQRLPRQTMSDFLTSIASSNPGNIIEGREASAPRGAINLERAFRDSQAFIDLRNEIVSYNSSDAHFRKERSNAESHTKKASFDTFLKAAKQHKSRYVSSRSAYTTSLFRQVHLCTSRELWQFKGHAEAFYAKLFCVVVCSFLLGSMFYNMPNDTDGVYSRGGFSFYSGGLIAWFQLAELESAFSDRPVVSRQKRFAIARPSAVVVAKSLLDMINLSALSIAYTLVAYFLSGMRREAGPFFIFLASIFWCGMAYTGFYRVLGATSKHLEVALRYCGILILATMVCGGYFRSISNLISEVPWVGWLGFLTPILYAYEIIMATEFHDRKFPCSSTAIIPAGLSYGDPAFQACASTGIANGQLTLDGDNYIQTQFGFSFNNVGRNFGILIAFWLGLLFINILLVETFDWGGHGGAILESAHKKHHKVSIADEESTNEPAASTSTSTSTLSAAAHGNLVQASSTFSWRNLNYSVPHKRCDKLLLQDVSGFCRPRTLTALVGTSGAGKSTLMSVLTQQATGKITGEMKLNENEVNASLGLSIGYCQQMDIHEQSSTVREAFEFSALLRQDSSISRRDKLAYVDTIMDVLGMTDVQDITIRTLSPEQRKRTTIGVELCAKPGLLMFLDEPTSGLDSEGAMSIIRLLRHLADAGLAIICTIHQASQEQFELFDCVLALNRGGRVYYFGETGPSGKVILDYFARHGVICPPDKNVADLLIEVAADKTPGTARDWCDIWAGSPEATAVLRQIDHFSNTKAGHKQTQVARPHREDAEYASSTLQQTIMLTKRTMRQYWRTPDYIYSRLYASVLHATLTGLVFLRLGNTVADMQYRVYAGFLVLMLVPEFINACSMMFVDNRNIWLGREYPSRICNWVAFSTAQIVSEIPFAVVGAVLYYVPFYFLIGLPLGASAGYAFLMMLFFHLFSTSWGQWIAALSSNAAMAASLMPFFIVMCEFFNGILQPQRLMPSIWAYTMYYISPFTYWIAGIVTTILPSLTIDCSESELIRFQAPPGLSCGAYAETWLSGANVKGYLVNPGATNNCGYCQYATGEDYLSTIDRTSSDAWPCLGIFSLFVATNYLSVYLWVYVKSVKRWLPW
ncbi:pleiotropic drug resistance protein, ABC superfamily [Aspergillus filifer]